MAINRGLAMVIALGALTMGCQDDSWYDNWYTETPVVPAADPTYDGSLNYDNAFVDAAFLGCLNSTADADFITAFGYNPASMPENFYLWYGYIEFIGVADDSSTLEVVYTDPETGAPGLGTSIYTEVGGTHGAVFGSYVGNPTEDNPSGSCDYLAPEGAVDGDFLFCDYFYADAMAAVDSCPETLPSAFQYIFNIRAPNDSGNAAYVIAQDF